jgi:hypothetical protein
LFVRRQCVDSQYPVQAVGYVVGFGENAPVNLHHRASYGDTWADFDSVIPNQNILYRVLVGGPAFPNDFDDEDDRTNEVAMDYNSAFTGALARSVSEFGGEPLTNAECHLQRYSTGCNRSSRMHCGFVSRSVSPPPPQG